jgi:hypothetical protein
MLFAFVPVSLRGEITLEECAVLERAVLNRACCLPVSAVAARSMPCSPQRESALRVPWQTLSLTITRNEQYVLCLGFFFLSSSLV